MMEVIETIVRFGESSLAHFWMPVAAWTVFAVALHVAPRLLRRVHAQIRYLMGLSLLVALPLGFGLAPFVDGGIAGAEMTQEVIESPRLASGSGVQEEPAVAVSEFGTDSSPAAEQIVKSDRAYPILPFAAGLAFLFACGFAAASTLRLLAHSLALMRLSRSLEPPEDRELERLFNRLARRIGLSRIPELRISPEDEAPMTFGWLRPIVVLPKRLVVTGACPEDVRHALAHELIHVRRRDFLFGSLARLVAATFAWHPLIRVIKVDLETHRELACDSEVLAFDGVDRCSYTRTLVRMSAFPFVQAGLSISTSKKILTKRIQAMKTPFDTIVSRPKAGVVASIVAVFLIVPAFLVACTVAEESAPSAEDALLQLEAEVAYLEGELTVVAAMKAEIEVGRSMDSRLSRELMEDPEYTTLRLREHILGEMRSAKRRQLEEARMNVAVRRVLDDR
jgi:beta-lactamase regulating signal transducer with metallopeptidase domain